MSQPGLEVITNSMEQLKTMFAQEMDRLQQRIDNPSSPRPAATTDSLNSDLNSFRGFVLGALQLLQDQLHVVSCDIDNIEMRSRRKILLLHGVPEEAKEDAAGVVAETVKQNLKIPDFDRGAISRCHRMGRLITGDKPRPILFKLTDITQRTKIWQAKSSLKNTGITMSEFLTKTRHDTFMAARKQFGLSKSWTQDGSVIVIGGDGARYRVNYMRELEKVPMSALGASASTAMATALALTKKPAKPLRPVSSTRPTRVAASKK